MNRLDGKVALITGAARGLGAATARVLGAQGARVVITDVLDEPGRQTCAALIEHGIDAMFCHHDVTSESQWDQVIEQTLARFGKLDILVNNAGIQLPKTVEDMSLAEFRQVMDVNLTGCFLGTRHGIAQMKSNGGAIVNIASNSTKTMVPLTTAYSPSKAAVANLSKVAALHCAKEGYRIRVNSVHPGPCETDMLTGGAEKAMDIPQVRQLIDAIPMGRMGQPSEVGEAVAFLASDAASYITATELFVDGGLTASMMK
jgi:3alpha(or 20beta)-hydroxysteroid dehydrogenase